MCLWFTIIFFLFNTSLGISPKYTDHYKVPLNISLMMDQFTRYVEDNICCIDGQWEAGGFLDYGAAISVPEATSYFHYNGTGKIAFDRDNEKSYIKFTITAFSPQIPVYSQFTTTTINDFHEGIMFNIDDDGHCTKKAIPKSMQSFCIPGNAVRISMGMVGDKVISTYQFTRSYTDTRHIITASVSLTGSTCDPVRVSQAVVYLDDVTHGTIMSTDVMDIKRGITDPSIFLPPKSCDEFT